MGRWVVMPTYNECENIPPLLREIFLVVPDVEVLVVDDKSPDGTADVVRTLQSTYPRLHLYVRDRKRGLGSAYIDTFQRLIATQGFETVTTMDADFSHSPHYLPQMHHLAEQYEVVIGSRYIDGGGTEGWGRRRRLLSASGNFYARLITGVPIKDLTAGFVTFRRAILEKIPFDQIHSTGYAYTIESKCLAIFAGARVIEIPIIFKDRRKGVSKLSRQIIFEAVRAPWHARSVSGQKP